MPWIISFASGDRALSPGHPSETLGGCLPHSGPLFHSLTLRTQHPFPPGPPSARPAKFVRLSIIQARESQTPELLRNCGTIVPMSEPLVPTKVPAKDRLKIATAQQRAEEHLRANLMAADRVLENKSITELAREYHLSADRVKEHLAMAHASGFYQQFEALVLDKLVPPAMAVYEAHLQRGSLEAARDVLFGMGVLRKNPKDLENPGVETIEAYRITRAKGPEGPQ